MKTTHTKWAVSKIGNNYDEYAIYSEDDGRDVAVTVRGKENAMLMSAAPEQNEALEEIDQRATEAILASDIGSRKNHTAFLQSELVRIRETARGAIRKAQE